MRYYQEPPTPRTILNTSFDDIMARADLKILKENCYESLSVFDGVVQQFEDLGNQVGYRLIDDSNEIMGEYLDPFTMLRKIRRVTLQKICADMPTE